MEDPLKSISTGVVEGLLSGVRGHARVEHASESGGSLEISGDYSSKTKNTEVRMTGPGTQIKISGNVKIIQQD